MMYDHMFRLGERLREFRRKAGMTLQDLAGKTRLSPGMLSKIENARAVPSLPVLFTLARVLKADPAALFEGMAEPGHPDYLLVRAKSRRRVERERSTGFRYEMVLERAMDSCDMQVLLLTVEPGGKRAAVTSEGRELIHILSGSFEFTLGRRKMILKTGDTLLFNGALPHRPVNLEKHDSSMLAFYFLNDKKG